MRDREALKIIGEVSVLSVNPEDVIVIEANMMLSRDDHERLIEMWKQASGLPNRTVVLAHAKVRKVTPNA